ncbi:hypothetical protein EZS27_020068 [termite gut metagenome]|uniref:Uncharacterized protein n=1 Tax=termite gut metagenome TaxID=433724 RepID=A0A5J4RB77_9ZZZZ
MEIKRLLEFNEIFGSSMKNAEEYLQGIDKRILIRIASYFLSGFYEDTTFLCTSGKFFSTPNSEFASKLHDYIRGEKEQIVIINKHASLFFLEKALAMPDSESDEFDSENEIKIMQAYLSINQLLVLRENPLITQIANLDEKDKLIGYMFYQPLAYSDFTNYDYRLEVVAQTIKAIHFFEFCEKNLPHHLALFYKKYNCKNWKGYMKSYLSIPYNQLLNKAKEISTIALKKDDKDFDKQKLFLNNFSINNHVKQADSDFTQIRKYPLYKESDSTYIVLFGIFSAERIYRSLYFDFKEINDIIDEKYRIKSFRGTITDIYSERFILYKVLDDLFNSERFIKLKGSDYKNHNKSIKGEPDYYARKNNDIFLFESKDILLNAEIKSSYDYNKIHDELRKKLNEDKGVKQLCSSIKNILNKEFPLDNDYEENAITIYPILILHERIYSNAGLNSIINEWYEESIKDVKSKIEKPERIKPLIVIDFDTLLLLQNLEQGTDFDFKDLLDQYIRKIEYAEVAIFKDIYDMVVNKYLSYKDFVEPIITKKIKKKDSPSELYIYKVALELFDESDIDENVELTSIKKGKMLNNIVENNIISKKMAKNNTEKSQIYQNGSFIEKKKKHQNKTIRRGKSIIKKRRIRKRNRRKHQKQ